MEAPSLELCENFDAQDEFDKITPLLSQIADMCEAAGIPFVMAFGVVSSDNANGIATFARDVEKRHFAHLDAAVAVLMHRSHIAASYEEGKNKLDAAEQTPDSQPTPNNGRFDQ